MRSIDTTKEPPDVELTCRCGKRILFWHTMKRSAHEKPECSFFTSLCEGLEGHTFEGEMVVIEPEKTL